MEKFYVMVNGQQQGPFTKEEIINKGFSKETYIYNKNLGGWKKISEISEFSSKIEDIEIESKASSTNTTIPEPNFKKTININKEPTAKTSSNKISEKFNKKEQEYKPIRITIIILTIINCIMESGYAASIGKAFNPISIVITYSIVVFLVRGIYKKNKNFENKVLVTFSIYIGVYLLKALIGIAIGISILKLAN